MEVNYENNSYPHPRSCAASGMIDETLFVAGGRNDKHIFNEIWAINLKNKVKAWEFVGAMTESRFHCKMIPMRDRFLLI